MLAWIHQSLATERELLQVLLKLCKAEGWSCYASFYFQFFSVYRISKSFVFQITNFYYEL